MVLVVVDEPLIHVIATRVLDRAGFEVLNASDGLQAIELVSLVPAPPCLVITDMRMPRMNGAEFGRWMQSAHPTVPVLYISGYLEEAPPVRDGERQRVWLSKPFAPDQLLAKVRELCTADLPALD